MLPKDSEGKYPTNAREFIAIKCLAACVSELHTSEQVLEQRLRTIPGGWRQYREIKSVSKKYWTRSTIRCRQRSSDPWLRNLTTRTYTS